MTTLTWFGTATWRLEVEDSVIWLDAYLDRAASAAPLPLRAAEVDRADWILIGHSHFDHIADAATIAKATGATVVGSQHSCDIVREGGVLVQNTIACSGGETLQLGLVTVRVFPSLHGFNGLKEWPDALGRSRAERTEALRATDPEMADVAAAHFRAVPPAQMEDGGPLAFSLEWDGHRVFWHDTPGMVTTSWQAVTERQPTLALLAVAAGFSTPNVDAQPWEGSHQEFVAHMADILRPETVILNHHDDWAPPITFHLDEESFRPHLEPAAKLQVLDVGQTISLD